MGLMKSLAIEFSEAKREYLCDRAKEDDPCLNCAFADLESYVCLNDGDVLGGGWGCKTHRPREDGNGATENAIPVAPVIFEGGQGCLPKAGAV